MATRHALLLALGIAFASPAFIPAPAPAQEEEEDRTVPEVKNAKHHFTGRITGGTVARSGPSNNFYATTKLEKGAQVTVVGMKYDYLKIVPPPGSFSLVPQVYVDRRGDGKIGRVNNALNVRAGSSENAMKSAIQMRLPEGSDVTILDEQDEYYKITPPEGAYVFVHKQYVEPVAAIASTATPPVETVASSSGAPDAAAAEQDAETPAAKPADETAEAPSDDAEGSLDETAELPVPTPAPDTRPSREAAAPAAAPKAVAANVNQDFRKLEAQFEAASKQSVIDQPIEQLTEGYTKLVESGALRGSMKRIADTRLIALRVRADARQQLREFQQTQEQMRQRQQQLAVERQEIDERIAQARVAVYAAVGTLRVSSLQQGGTLLYRLTDPATGRTVVYVRSNDPKYAGLLNQFVGVRGEVANDARLRMKIITPTEAEAVDASKVNNGVIATIVPPSMVTIATTGDAGVND